ncbi:MAG: hypothetical protein Q9220_000143 [cf. Caloplaca sp. 1 TL-2023]
MPGSITPLPTPQALLYLRSLNVRPLAFQTPTIHHHLQIRTKRKSANRPQTIPVRLLQDIPGYGRKGAIIPIPPGRMRNIYHPSGKADYVTAAQLRTLNPKDIQSERDFAFGLSSDVSSPSSTTKSTQSNILPTENIKAKLLTVWSSPLEIDYEEMKVANISHPQQPKRTLEVIDSLLPPTIVFYRPPITTTTSNTPSPSPATEPLGTSINAIGGAAAAPVPAVLPEPAPKTSVTRIYGSVTTADIVESIKAVLAGDEEGKRVVLGSEDVVFLDEVDEEKGVEVGRVKAVGEFAVEVRVRGVEGGVGRRVSVRAMETDGDVKK